jgi:hypothetical protein
MYFRGIAFWAVSVEKQWNGSLVSGLMILDFIHHYSGTVVLP